MKYIAKLLLIALALMPVSCGKPQKTAPEKPLIGISTGYSSKKATINMTYVDAVVRGGGVPFILPLIQSEALAEELLGMCDGLILSGGEDIDPAYFGEELLDNGTVSINGPRDTSDMLLTGLAVKMGMPILAICRGEQVANVALGGSLYQDIPSQHPSDIRHSQDEAGTVGTQTVHIKSGSYVHKLLGVDSLRVNSFHHQAVKDPAEALTVVGQAADGIVEIYEGLPETNIIGTQFHPEIFTQAGDTMFLKFFTDLMDRAKEYRSSK